MRRVTNRDAAGPTGSSGSAHLPGDGPQRRPLHARGARLRLRTLGPEGTRRVFPGVRPTQDPGWALVGDAGYNKDFITAQGISDAFRDAELCVSALDESFAGRRLFDEAMGAYQAVRDAQVLPIYELTTDFATLEPPPPQMQTLLAAMAGNQEAMDGFARVNAGVTSPADFFAEDNVGRILATAGGERRAG